jgi:hypothetical protein
LTEVLQDVTAARVGTDKVRFPLAHGRDPLLRVFGKWRLEQ